MAKKTGAKVITSSFGIAEWYGKLYKTLGLTDYPGMLATGTRECPFLAAAPELAPRGGPKCNKPGGVCSIRKFTLKVDESIEFGDIVTTCPNRFLEDRTVLTFIGEMNLGTSDPVVLKEIPFLKRVSSGKVEGDEIPEKKDEDAPANPVEKAEDVGSIDLVLMHPDAEPKRWAAVEMQAVYFSGDKMKDDFDKITVHTGNGIPMPGGNRRPDFRSSGPKRLMPQLQIKVPSLRRWGKKTIIIIDRPFLNSMAPMREVGDISNADIVWLVVNYKDDISRAELFVEKTVMTTLEDAVIGLTAGEPTTLSDFEAKLGVKIAQRERAERRRLAVGQAAAEAAANEQAAAQAVEDEPTEVPAGTFLGGP